MYAHNNTKIIENIVLFLPSKPLNLPRGKREACPVCWWVQSDTENGLWLDSRGRGFYSPLSHIDRDSSSFDFLALARKGSTKLADFWPYSEKAKAMQAGISGFDPSYNQVHPLCLFWASTNRIPREMLEVLNCCWIFVCLFYLNTPV